MISWGGYHQSSKDRFRALLGEIIEYFQCIEYDLKRIYSAISSEDFDECMDTLEGDNWGVVLNKLKGLDYTYDDPYLSQNDYQLLDEIRERRNYWCHQCYLDFVYIENDYERENRLQRLIRQLENEKNRVSKLQNGLESFFLNTFGD